MLMLGAEAELGRNLTSSVPSALEFLLNVHECASIDISSSLSCCDYSSAKISVAKLLRSKGVHNNDEWAEVFDRRQSWN
jgi:hypothetical protein